MLTLKADAVVGADLRNEVLPQMLLLAQQLNAIIELQGNETLFTVFPTDTLDGLKAAHDRLYPASSMVSTILRAPVRRPPPPPPPPPLTRHSSGWRWTDDFRFAPGLFGTVLQVRTVSDGSSRWRRIDQSLTLSELLVRIGWGNRHG